LALPTRVTPESLSHDPHSHVPECLPKVESSLSARKNCRSVDTSATIASIGSVNDGPKAIKQCRCEALKPLLSLAPAAPPRKTSKSTLVHQLQRDLPFCSLIHFHRPSLKHSLARQSFQRRARHHLFSQLRIAKERYPVIPPILRDLKLSEHPLPDYHQLYHTLSLAITYYI